MAQEVLTVEIVSERLTGFISKEYKWAKMPYGWQLEFIVYPDGLVDMDFLHPISGVFWSEDNGFLDMPVLPDGSRITADILKKAGVPYMTTFGHAEVSDKPTESHLKLVND